MDPQVIDVRRMIALLTYHRLLGDRSAIIYDDKYRGAVKTYIRPLLDRFGFKEVLTLDPIHAKGMEFDNVFVVGMAQSTYNERYVACSRALNELYIVQAGGKDNGSAE